ncbi:zinc carboxypeptidase, partial [Aphelenchoides avenae]
MQPVLFSVTEAKQGRPGWVHAGSSVCYYRNLYTPPGDTPQDEGPKKRLLGAIFAATERPTRRAPLTNAGANSVQNAAGGGAQGGADKSSGTDSDSPTKTGGNSETKSFFSIRFTVKFRHAADVCYIAYHFPYTYSYLQATLESWLARCSANSSIYARLDHLPSTTLAGNSVPVVTVTAPGTAAELADREIVVLSARVHPGESNSSWIMHGVLRFLLSESPKAVKAREQFVFKLVPMLNPDGVINGSHRCSLAGVDLNRVWDRPSATLHPTIHHTKGLIQYMVDVLKKVPYVLVDIHGHSRKANIFMFGNNPEESWRLADHAMARSGSLFSLLPELLEQVAPGFSLKDCKFSVTKTKEPSARIALWRQFGIERCYTMESTYCGFDTGAYSGKQ